MMNTKETEEVIEELFKLFKKNMINAIIDFPNFGTVSMFTSEGGKLCVLEHAKMETETNDNIIHMRAEIYASNKIDETAGHKIIKKEHNLSYIA